MAKKLRDAKAAIAKILSADGLISLLQLEHFILKIEPRLIYRPASPVSTMRSSRFAG
jgi:hypothetical protein